MDPFEVSIEYELFRISERSEPHSPVSYDFAWLNGPADGTYGFSVGGSSLSEEQLVAQVQGFVSSFYERGGIGEEDFPDHIPARLRERNRE